MERSMWTLIIYIYAGVFAKGDSVALLSVPNFSTEAACVAAAGKTAKFTDGSAKEHRFTCVKQ